MLSLTRSLTIFTIGVELMCVSFTRAQTKAASRQRIAIAHLEFKGKIPDVLQELFAHRLYEGLSAARFEVIANDSVKKTLHDNATSLMNCKQASCYQSFASKLRTSYLITAEVSESNKTYTITMDIINGLTGRVLASNRERCETCGVEEAGEKMGLAASALRERLEIVSRNPARFIIRSRPAGATVMIDGKDMGPTPLSTDVTNGDHHIKIVHARYATLERDFTAVSGVDETMAFDLLAIPSYFPYRAAGVTAIVSGVLLVTAGIIAMTFNGDEKACSQAEKDDFGHCPWVHNTRWIAASLMGAGIVAGTLGGVFIYLDPRRSNANLALGYHRNF